jgi:rubrerythrin
MTLKIATSMSENEFKITMRTEFLSLLGKAFWLEAQFENVMQWQAYMTVKNDSYRNVLFQLSHDSEKHKGIILQLITHFEDVTSKTLEEHSGMVEKEFDLKGKWDEEIITELLKNEYLALDVYTKLHRHTDKDFIKKIWKGSDSDQFFKQLEFLINEEKKHINLLTPLAGKLERIL